MKMLIVLFFCVSQVLACNSENKQATNQTNPPPVLVSIDSIPQKTEIQQASPPPKIKSNYRLPYQLNFPNNTFKLPASLTEISGLSNAIKADQLCAVEDETGVIYVIDKTQGDVLKKVKFWKKGDYEGIECVDDVIYVIKSTGTLYEVQNFNTENQEVIKYNTFLTRENDVEGLGYDSSQNCLLIACKGLPKGEESYDLAKLKKEVYKFDLKTKKMNPQPAFTISQEIIYNFMQKYDMGHDTEKLIKYFQPDRSLTFSPSAIATHPITKNVYILSSVKKIIIVLNSKGKMQYINLLNKKTLLAYLKII